MFEKNAMNGDQMAAWMLALFVFLFGSSVPAGAEVASSKVAPSKVAPSKVASSKVALSKVPSVIEPQSAPPVELLHIQEAAPDVRVFLRWTEEGELPQGALLKVVDVFGAEVSSTWIPAPEPGLSEVMLPEALVDLVPRGTHFMVRLETVEGEVLGDPLAYRVGLRCDEPGTCRFVVFSGLNAPNTLLMSGQLESALEEASAAGTDDLLGWVLDNRPHLWGEAMTLGWELEMMEGSIPTKGGCTCRFLTQINHWNNLCVGCGAAHYISVSLRPDIDPWGGASGRASDRASDPLSARSAGAPGLTNYLEINGGTELRVAAECWKILPGVETPVGIEAGEWEGAAILPTVTLGNCNKECISSVTYSAEVPVELHAEADMGYAIASEHVHFEVDGTIFLQQGQIASTPYQGGTDTKQQTFSSIATAGLGASAYLETLGIVDLQSTAGQNAYGWIDSQFALDASATSSCTGPADVDVGVKLDLNFSGGSGASINVLIGKVDG